MEPNRLASLVGLLILVAIAAVILATHRPNDSAPTAMVPTDMGSALAPSAIAVKPRSTAAMHAVVRDSSLDTDGKLGRLQEFIGAGVWLPCVLHYMAQVHPTHAVAVAVEAFRAPDATVPQRLGIGGWLLGRHPSRGGELPPGFDREYAAWLVQAAIADNGDSLMVVTELGTETPVAHLAWWAGGHQGFPATSFPTDADRRVIPVLVRCLDAPDAVWPAQQGDCVHGEPGTSTRRNSQRQCIPLALAALKATETIPDLVRVLRGNGDINLRANAAFALGALTGEPRRRALEREIVEKAERNWLVRRFRGGTPRDRSLVFPFGHGLIEQGDAAGIRYLDPAWLAGTTNPGTAQAMLWWVKSRLEAVGSFRHARLIEFYRTALIHPVLAPIWRFDAHRASIPIGCPAPGQSLLEVRRSTLRNWENGLVRNFRCLVGGVRSNGFVELAPEIKAIADATGSPAIASVATEALTGWPP